MTGKKTGALIATATELGGLVGEGSVSQVKALRRFGLRLGRAFQVQDDILDVVGDPHDFGKAIGGDILEGKKTYLLLRAAERAGGDDMTLIGRVLRKDARPGEWKNGTGTPTREGEAIVAAVKDVYTRCGVLRDATGVVRTDHARGAPGARTASAVPRTGDAPVACGRTCPQGVLMTDAEKAGVGGAARAGQA